MIIKASQRSGARNLANHLSNSNDNDHVLVHDIRGLNGQSIHSALLEIDAVSQGTRCQQPLFSVSFNPPMGENVTHAQFDHAFERFERKLGLDGQPRVVVFHEKEGRRHCHVVWSRIDVSQMKAINMSHYKRKCGDVSRDLYREHGWDMPEGLRDKKDRDPFQLSNAEWQRLKRNGIDPKEIKQLIQSAWAHSDNLPSFQLALEEKGLHLAKGDKRGFVIMDDQYKVYSLSRHGGVKTKDIKVKLGKPDHLRSVAQTEHDLRKTYRHDLQQKVRDLKTKHIAEQQPLIIEKRRLVEIQRAERMELQDQQRIKRNLSMKTITEKYRNGIRGVFDKINGRNKRLKLIGQKKLKQLKKQQSESREQMIFRHNRDRAKLQTRFAELRDRHIVERTKLAKRIHDLKRGATRDQTQTEPKKSKLGHDFSRSVEMRDRSTPEKVKPRNRSRKRTLE